MCYNIVLEYRMEKREFNGDYSRQNDFQYGFGDAETTAYLVGAPQLC